MDKSRQKYLQQWLRIQQKPIKKYLNLNILLATFSSVILVGQTYLLASLLHKLIILGEPVWFSTLLYRLSRRLCATCADFVDPRKNRLQVRSIIAEYYSSANFG